MRLLRTPTPNGSLAVFLAICLCGCTAGSGPQPVRAGGVVMYNGKPLPNAEVVFAPEGQGRVASATTDENGRFRLGTFRPGDGALVGKHRVAVIARGPAKKPPPGSPAALMPDDYTVPGDPRIPKKYFSAATSGLTAVVDPNGDNEFDFQLRE
jgi:hypothetical protein